MKKIANYSVVLTYEIATPSGNSVHKMEVPVRGARCSLHELGHEAGEQLQAVIDIHLDNAKLKEELTQAREDLCNFLQSKSDKPTPKKRGRPPKKLKENG